MAVLGRGYLSQHVFETSKFWINITKQSPQGKSCSKKFHEIHRETSLLEHLFSEGCRLPANFPKFSTFSISCCLRKENITLKATKTVNQKKHKYILKLKFYLKSYFAAYFLKTILNKASLIFPFSFPCRFITLIKKRFQYVKCFSQVAAKHTTNILKIKKIVMLKTRKWKSVKHSI